MGQKIHFEDNIFFLNEIVRTLQRNITLKPDPEFFHEKIKADLAFLDSALTRLFTILHDSPHLINRQQYLRYLMKTMNRFNRLLDSFSDETHFEPHFDLSQLAGVLQDYKNNQENNIKEIAGIIFTSTDKDNQDQVSQEEFKCLFLDNP